MDNWGCLLLYRKKLVLPRVYQLVDWFSQLACFFAILFIASIVYRYGFTVTEEVHSVLDSVSNAVWIVFLINTTLSHLFSNDSSAKFTVWTWLLDVCLYLTLLPVVFHLPEPDGLVCYGRYSDFMKFWKSVKQSLKISMSGINERLLNVQ